jgi:hypothetical protein
MLHINIYSSKNATNPVAEAMGVLKTRAKLVAQLQLLGFSNYSRE